MKHQPGYASAGHLLSVTKSGYPGFDMDAVGEEFDSEGSGHIIKIFKVKTCPSQTMPDPSD